MNWDIKATKFASSKLQLSANKMEKRLDVSNAGDQHDDCNFWILI